ncbi:MAG: acyltransferase family protein [Parvibaculum sp.]|nr:acyltransferase family protein [Parvibaculum sp.]|tara:strand:- start:2685 stop:3719 length:1035 start_codon:yes stop_codon:yes gene_type:complete
MVTAPAKPRVDWIDAVKGLTIILVVVSHTTYGTAAALNSAPYYFELLCEWAVPFRMPLFFLVAGLFAQKALRAPLLSFIDSKILHFVYFYVLWSTIQIGIKMALPHSSGWTVTYLDLLMIPLEPFGLMWFLYALVVFFAFMRLVRDVRPAIVITLALALYFANLDTAWMMPNEFAHRFIFFTAGVYGAPHVFNAAQWAINNPKRATLTGLFLLVGVAELVFAGDTALRPVELLASFAGAAGMIMLVAILASRGWTKPLAYVGSHSLYVFLAFFLPMAVARTVMIKLGVTEGDVITLVTAVTAVGLPLVAYAVVKHTPLVFFFDRPDAMKLAPAAKLPTGALPAA